MNDRHLPWIDWMKAIGMGLIVFGHSGGDTIIPPITHPFNPKQLGVAFFVFITGYTLAAESRPSSSVIFKRLFDVYLWTGVVAVVLSVIKYISIGDLNESNYLPLILGINVFDNDFPANPTTWYVGCYLHILLLWAWYLRTVVPSIRLIACLAIIEVMVRATLMSIGRDYTAYMLVTNWLMVFSLGLLYGRKNMLALDTVSTNRGELTIPPARPMTKSIVAFLLLVMFVPLWMWMIVQLGITTHNPFGRVDLSSRVASAFLTSCSVSLLYTVYTLALYYLLSSFPSNFFIRFLARNTLLVFLVHMPLIYAVTPKLYPYVPQGIGRVVVNQCVFFVAIALFSELFLKLIRFQRFRTILLSRFSPRKTGSGPAGYGFRETR